MSDLISRQALCEYALNQKDKSVTPNDIMRFPSVQPEPKRGKWITEVKHYKDKSQDFYYEHTRCSICGAKKRIGWYDANYCPNCGARMDGEANE